MPALKNITDYLLLRPTLVGTSERSNNSETNKTPKRTIRELKTPHSITQQINAILKEEEEKIKKGENPSIASLKSERKLSEFGISAIKNDPIIEKYGQSALDCQNWAFSKMNLPKYKTNRIFGTRLDTILKRDFPDLKMISTPQKGALVIYLTDDNLNGKDSFFPHYGIVSDVTEKGRVYVNSKWGYSQLFNHPISYVPRMYGDKVAFFEKK